MWYEIGIKIAQEPGSLATYDPAAQQQQPLEQPPSVLDTAGNLGAGLGSTVAGVASGVPATTMGNLGARIGSRFGGKALGTAGMAIGKRLPMGLSLVAGIPAAYMERNPGGAIGSDTPEEQAFQAATRRGDQNAWQHLPAGYETSSNIGAIEGLATAPFMLHPATAAATIAGQVPGWASSGNRLRQGDTRESFYNPAMMHHLFARPANAQNMFSSFGPQQAGAAPDTRGLVRKFWADELRPTGNVIRQYMTRPVQTLASGAGMLGQDFQNVFGGFGGKPKQPAAAPVPQVARAPAPQPPAPPALPKPPSTVT